MNDEGRKTRYEVAGARGLTAFALGNGGGLLCVLLRGWAALRPASGVGGGGERGAAGAGDAEESEDTEREMGAPEGPVFKSFSSV